MSGRGIGRTILMSSVASCLMLCAAAVTARSEPLGRPEATPRPEAAARPEAAEAGRREELLRSLEQGARTSAEARTRLEREITGLKADGARLAGALVAAARRATDAEERVRAAEIRLDALLAEQSVIHGSLERRRNILAEVLAALQRLGRGPPPPPLVVQAPDIVAALRGGLLLGALTPELATQARRLAAELERLAALRTAIDADRAALEADYAALATERDRIATLVQARQERLAATENAAGRERSRGESLGREARSLRELLDRMAEDQARERRRLDDQRTAEAEARLAQERFAAAAAREPPRLSPRQPFAESRGALIRPASGPVVRDYGTPDGGSGTMRGTVIATRPRSIVTAPADGTVVFAGPFRSYGRLVIVNAGGGYYLLFAGVETINVEIGQFVLAGEPIAQMGEVAAPSAALGVVEANGPLLYVEFRKDGGPIDPGPWWAKSQSERARG